MFEVPSTARPVRMLVARATVLMTFFVAAGLLSAATPTAQAGTYQARQCWEGETWPAPYLSDAYQRAGSNYGSYPYIFSDYNCGDGSEYMGVGATYSWASYGDYAYWAFDAPANTSFTRFTANRIYSAVHYYNNTGIFVRSGGAYQTLFHHYTNGTAYDGPGDWAVSGDQIISQVWCTGFGCDPTSANGIYLTSMTFRLNDPHPPTISNVQGSVFSGGWKKPGTESVSGLANDLGGGVSKVGLKVTNGSSTTETAQQPSNCTTTSSGYAAVLRPCPLQASYSRSVNTANPPFASGISTVSVCTSDYANLGSAPSEDCEAATLKLDGQPPSQSISGNGWTPAGNVLTGGNKTIGVSASDGVQGGAANQRQSGVDRIELRVWRENEARPSTPTMTRTQTGTGCGTTQDSCPLSATFTYDPAAYTTAAASNIKVEVIAVDEAGNTTPVIEGTNRKTFTVVASPDPETTITEGPSGTITTSAATFRFTSSIPGSSFECRMDGGAWATCASPKTYTGLIDGDHVFEVRAKFNGVADQTPASRAFFVDADVTQPDVTVTTGPPAADGSYAVTIRATDPPAGQSLGSGVEHLELLVDGVLVQEWNQTCTAGCSMTRTVTLNGSQSTADHEIQVFAGDRSGNEALQRQGKRWIPYSSDSSSPYNDRFGYNDNFEFPSQPERVEIAYEGGARLIRFAVEWCRIAVNRDPSNPDSWDWAQYEPIFQAVQNHNNTPGLEKMNILIYLTDSPPWAATHPDGAGAACGDDQDPPTRSHDLSWRMFVRETLERFANPATRPGNGVEAVEIWNEPNIPRFWGGGAEDDFDPQPDRYAELFNAAFAEIEALRAAGTIRPGLKLLSGGTSPVRNDRNDGTSNPAGAGRFLKNALQNVPVGRVDGISIHLYAPTGTRVEDSCPRGEREECGVGARQYLEERYRDVRGFVDELGSTYADKRLWITEIGMPTTDGSNTDQFNPATQMRRLRSAFNRYGSRSPKVGSFIVHNLINNSAIDDNVDFGVLNNDPPVFSAKNGSDGAYCQLAALAAGTMPPERC